MSIDYRIDIFHRDFIAGHQWPTHDDIQFEQKQGSSSNFQLPTHHLRVPHYIAGCIEHLAGIESVRIAALLVRSLDRCRGGVVGLVLYRDPFAQEVRGATIRRSW